MVGLQFVGGIIFQGRTVIHSRIFDEGEHYSEEAQWRSSRTFWHRQDIIAGRTLLFLAKVMTRRAEVRK